MPIVRAGPRYLGLDYLIQADASNPDALVVIMARGDPFEVRGEAAAELLAQLDFAALPPPGTEPGAGTGATPAARVVRAHKVHLPEPATATVPAADSGGSGESV